MAAKSAVTIFLFVFILFYLAKAESAVIECHTMEEFNQQIELSKELKKPAVVFITATAAWCPSCFTLSYAFGRHPNNFPQGVFLSVDATEVKEVLQAWKVRIVPTFFFLKEGLTVDTMVGNDLNQLLYKTKELMANNIIS